MKFCEDCKHFEGRQHLLSMPRHMRCLRSDLAGPLFKVSIVPAIEERGPGQKCGPDGLMFEPKPPEEPGLFARLFRS